MTEAIKLAKEVGASVYTNRHLPDRPFMTFSPEQLDAFVAAIRGKPAEPIAHFDFQKNRFRWATTTSIGPVPVSVRVEPMALYSAPTHIENVDSVCTSQERVQKLEKSNQMLLEALKYHMAQTRPIQQSIDAIAQAEGVKG